MWTVEHRERYRRDEAGYPSNLTNAEWDRLSPLVPDAKPGGRPRKTDMRMAVNAMFYLPCTGWPWCYFCGRLSSLACSPEKHRHDRRDGDRGLYF